MHASSRPVAVLAPAGLGALTSAGELCQSGIRSSRSSNGRNDSAEEKGNSANNRNDPTSENFAPANLEAGTKCQPGAERLDAAPAAHHQRADPSKPPP